MNVHYRIAYLADGQRTEQLVVAPSAAAAVQCAQATASGSAFELLSVQVIHQDR